MVLLWFYFGFTKGKEKEIVKVGVRSKEHGLVSTDI
jgi:hypothetical protein